jgi:hypothetical protein
MAMFSTTTKIVVALIGATGAVVAAYIVSHPSPSAPRESDYSGRILEKNSRKPIAGAQIVLKSSGPPVHDTTDSDGVFFFSKGASGREVSH